tara:strand:+ start:249 stop:665 length:417 start_codon:yes stop_codon:yes gene_type:complete
MKTVMCFGTFDLLHLGHLDYFKQAKKCGDHLTVVIARDSTKEKMNKVLAFSELERLQMVRSLQVVDQVVLGNHDNHLQIVEDLKPDVICLGYDHPISVEELKRKLGELGLIPEVVRMQPYQTSKHKTTFLKEKVLKTE